MNRLIIEVGIDQLRRYTKRYIQDVGVLKWRDLLNTTCNKQLHVFIGLLYNILNVVLIITASWLVSLMVVVLKFPVIDLNHNVVCMVF